MRRVAELGAPLALIGAVAIVGAFVSAARQLEFLDALVAVAMVVSLYVFVGNSGCCRSGRRASSPSERLRPGVMTAPTDSKAGQLPDLFPFLKDHAIGNVPSLLLAAVIGAVYALIVGMPLMRLRAWPPDRHVRRARDHAQRASLLDEGRPGGADARARPRDDGRAPGGGWEP